MYRKANGLQTDRVNCRGASLPKRKQTRKMLKFFLKLRVKVRIECRISFFSDNASLNSHKNDTYPGIRNTDRGVQFVL